MKDKPNFEFDSRCPNSSYVPSIQAQIDRLDNSLLQQPDCTWAYLGNGKDGQEARRYLFWTSLNTNEVGAGKKIPVIIQTGDFKIDFTPIEGNVINLARFGELGRKGVLALLSDSTNAERPGSTPSERTVGESFTHLFNSASTRRIIIASFSSNIHRIQQIVDTAWRFGRKIAVSGRSTS